MQAVLGHASLAETLEVCTHLWPTDEDRTRHRMAEASAPWLGAELRQERESLKSGASALNRGTRYPSLGNQSGPVCECVSSLGRRLRLPTRTCARMVLGRNIVRGRRPASVSHDQGLLRRPPARSEPSRAQEDKFRSTTPTGRTSPSTSRRLDLSS